jgi:quercetin dioxygenase-like cupin family protein
MSRSRWATVPGAAASVLWVARYDYAPGTAVRTHTHPHHQWFHVLAGAGRFVVDGAEHLVPAGGSLQVQPNCRHGLAPADRRRLATLDVKYTVRDRGLARAVAGTRPAVPALVVRTAMDAVLEEAQAGASFIRERCAARWTDLLWAAARAGLPGPALIAPVPWRCGDAVVDGLADWIRAHLAQTVDGAALPWSPPITPRPSAWPSWTDRTGFAARIP